MSSYKSGMLKIERRDPMRLSSTNLKWLVLHSVIGSFAFLLGGIVMDVLSSYQLFLIGIGLGGLIAGLFYGLFLKDKTLILRLTLISTLMSFVAFLISFWMGYVLVDLAKIENERILSLLLLGLYALLLSGPIAWVIDGFKSIPMTVGVTLILVEILALLSPGLFASYVNFALIYAVFGAGIGCGHGLHLLKQKKF